MDRYEGHRAALHRYLRRLVHDEDTAQDLTAATLRSAQQGPPGVGEEAASWLLTVAHDELIRAARARAVTRDVQLVAEIARDAGLVTMRPRAARVSVVGKGECGDEGVWAALAQLGSGEQEVLCLGAWKALSSRGLGVVLGCSAGTSRVRLHRARQRLRRLVLSA